MEQQYSSALGGFPSCTAKQSKTRRWGWFRLAVNTYIRSNQRTETDTLGSDESSPNTSIHRTERALGSWLKMPLQERSKEMF